MRNVAAGQRQSRSRVKVLCHPGFPYRAVIGPARPLPEAFDWGKAYFYMSGSTALWHGLKLLRLEPHQTILFPSYHCGRELDVLYRSGCRVVLYPVGRGLCVDPDELRRRAGRDTRALYLIHYWGFPQTLDSLHQLCAEKGWALIEDCAHALFARYQNRPVGSLGDIAIFSLRKTLPLPGGGALVVNNRSLAPACTAAPASRRAAVYFTLDLLLRDLRRLPFVDVDAGLRAMQLLSRTARSLNRKET